MTITQTRFRATRGADTERRGPGSRFRPSSPGQRRPGEGGSGGQGRGQGSVEPGRAAERRGPVAASDQVAPGRGGQEREDPGARVGVRVAQSRGERLEARPSSHRSPLRPRCRAHAGAPPSAAEAKEWWTRWIWTTGHVPQRLRPMPGPRTSLPLATRLGRRDRTSRSTWTAGWKDGLSQTATIFRNLQGISEVSGWVRGAQKSPGVSAQKPVKGNLALCRLCQTRFTS